MLSLIIRVMLSDIKPVKPEPKPWQRRSGSYNACVRQRSRLYRCRRRTN